MTGQTGSRLQSTPAATCLKILLTVFNFIFWVSGIAILALGIWLKMELHLFVDLTENYNENTPYVLIGVGAGIVLIGSLGCVCTVKGKGVLLYVYAALLIVIFLAELSVAIAAFYYKGKVEAGFTASFERAMDDMTNYKDQVDQLQSALGCCGASGYKDWFAIDWKGTGPSDAVPDSCCIDQVVDCGQTPTNGTINERGCSALVTTFLEDNFIIIGSTAIGFSFLQLFGALIACCLAKNLNKSKYEQVA